MLMENADMKKQNAASLLIAEAVFVQEAREIITVV
jgi:hypothetical protein